MPNYRNFTTDKDKKDLLIVTLFAFYFFETARFNFCIFRLCEKSLPKNLCKVYPTVKFLHSFQCILSPQAKRGGLLPLQSLRAKRSGLILKTRLPRRAFALLAMTDYRGLPHSQNTKANASNDEERHVAVSISVAVSFPFCHCEAL